MIKYRDMNVKDGRAFGIITAEQQERAVAAWLDVGVLTGTFLQAALDNAEAPQEVCYRGADRLLQKLRKAGIIRHTGGGKWVQA